MSPTIDTALYFAKATIPANNPWRTPYLTREQAIAKAQWFVRQWMANGLSTVEAGVFYRDGSIHALINATNCDLSAHEPDADINRMEHDDRGDN